MTAAEKIRDGKAITREEFKSLIKNTNWSGYVESVIKDVSTRVEEYEKAQARSLAGASHKVYR